MGGELLISSFSYEDPFARSPLLVDIVLSSEDRRITFIALVDTGATGYSFIDEISAQLVCDKLGIAPTPLSKPRPIKGFDGQNSLSPITHMINPNLTVQGHMESQCPMLITKLGNHPVIIEKPWMNKHGVLLDMKDDKIVFVPGRCTHWGATPPPALPLDPATRLAKPTNETPISPKYKILKREAIPYPAEATNSTAATRGTKPWSINQRASGPAKRLARPLPPKAPQETKFTVTSSEPWIASVGAAAFKLLASRKSREEGNKCFAMTMNDIDTALAQHQRAAINPLEVNELTEETDVLTKLPSEYHDFVDVFDRTKADELPPHRTYDHKIIIEGEGQMPRSKIYPMSGDKLQKVKEYLKENLKKGFISPSTAPYASPVLFVVKPNGSLRFCVDYRKLNALTRRNRYPIPLIDETLARVTGCKYLTKLDIIAAFNKLRMHPDSEDYTTFVTSMGAYKYHVLPFGLTNGPANYQHYMNDVLFECLNRFCQAYLDDILIYSKTRKEHVQHVRQVLSKLRGAGLQVDIEKCEFHVQETAFLGVLLSVDGIRMNPEKVQVVIDWARPNNLKQVQAFVGFCNFYRRFIKNFSKIVRPLTQLTQKDIPFQWTIPCQQAFEQMKKAVTSAPVLRHFDRERKAVLETDSSDYVNGGVLSQYDDDGVLHPVAFFSKSMLPAECNYEIYDKELLAIIKCLEHWRPELEATDLPIDIYTDHKALEHFMTSKELTRRQARWSQKLSEFNFRIMYQTGPRNAKADALTRLPNAVPRDQDDDRLKYQHQTILTPDRLETMIMVMNLEDPIHAQILAANKVDQDCTDRRKALEEGKDKWDGVSLKGATVVDGALYREGALWVPDDVDMYVHIIREAHDPPACGHPGVARTMELIRRDYYWPGMKTEIQQYIRNCYSCQRSKAPRDKYNGLLKPLPIPEQRWKDISMDFITGLPESEGYNAILTVIDRLSKERHYIPCVATDEGTSATATAKLLIRWVFRLHGLPDSIVSDRGPQFVATVWESFCKRLRITPKLSTAFHPQTDGQTERANQDVERQLRTYCGYMQDDWVDCLPMAEFADNNAFSATTGLTPFFANKGFHPRMGFSPDPTAYLSTRERLLAAKAEDITDAMKNTLELMINNAKKARKAMTAQANKHRKEVTYKEGDMVFLSSRNIKTARPADKLEDKMLGPFRIKKVMGSAYQLDLPVTMKIHDVFHPSLLRKDPGDPLPNQIQEPPGPIIVDGEKEWELDDILNSRRTGRGRRLQYQVKWKDDPKRDQTWYNADGGEFDHSADLIGDFHRRYPEKPGPA